MSEEINNEEKIRIGKEHGVTRVTAGVIDHFDPQVQAMLIARFSRDPKYIADRLPKNDKELESAREALERIYLSWQHKSVGQLGHTSVFFEKVSVLAAWYLTDTRYFQGQECSTRYLDFSEATFESAGSSEVAEIQQAWMDAYRLCLPLAKKAIRETYVKSTYGKENGEAELSPRELKAIDAKAFDIARSLLPAGVHTSVAWSGTFDTLRDHMQELVQNDGEVGRLVKMACDELHEVYPHGFPSYETIVRDAKTYGVCNNVHDDLFHGVVSAPADNMVKVGLRLWDDKRPAEASPRKMSRANSNDVRVTVSGVLDFGSLRDLHRHRPGLLTAAPRYEGGDWRHLFSHDVAGAIEKLLRFGYESAGSNFRDSLQTSELARALEKAEAMYSHYCRMSDLRNRYKLALAMPLGHAMKYTYTCDLNQALYVLKLRSKITSNYTLRNQARAAFSGLSELWGTGDQSIVTKIRADEGYLMPDLERGDQA